MISRRRNIYLATQDTLKETGIHTTGRLRRRNPSKRAAKTRALARAANGLCTEVCRGVTTVGVCGSKCLFVIELFFVTVY